MINELVEKIQHAAAHQEKLEIRGSGSKSFYGGVPQGTLLDMSAHHGIIDYAPTELVLTARSGTPLSEVEALLAEQNQMLAFEPPNFGAPHLDTGATLGGCIASGLSGPRRAYSGAVRDFVLGVGILDGRGQHTKFGGQVMKNVAGYDVSRLMTGAMGTLGVLLDVSLKVLPRPAATLSLRFECDQQQGIQRVNAWAGQTIPLSATCWQAGNLTIRLEGTQRTLQTAHSKLGGELVADDATFWRDIREQRKAFFQSTLPLWRLSVPSTAAPLDLQGVQLIEWGGALRWLVSDAAPQTIRGAAVAAGGQAILFRGGDKRSGVFHPLPPALLAIQRRIKNNFDPQGVFNPYRLFDEF